MGIITGWKPVFSYGYELHLELVRGTRTRADGDVGVTCNSYLIHQLLFNAMDKIRITHANDPLLDTIQPLYEQSFPEKERRDFSQLRDLLKVDIMQLIALTDDSSTIGFFILWEFEKFNYIEHIAIDPLQRGKNYGSTIIKQITDSSQKILLLEVEPGEDETSKRRIHFYERLGMKLCSFDYKQPPYRKNEKPFPMLIMSFPNELSKELFEEYTSIIKAEVYERWR